MGEEKKIKILQIKLTIYCLLGRMKSNRYVGGEYLRKKLETAHGWAFLSVCKVKQRTSIHSLAGMYECALRGTVLRTEQEDAALLRRRWRLSPVSAIRQVNRRL